MDCVFCDNLGVFGVRWQMWDGEYGPSTHFMRKSFGRKVYSNNNESEHALVLLMDIFNHSSLQITKRYLGIRQEEIYDVYDGIQLYN